MELDFRNSFKGKKFTQVDEAEKEFKRKQRENHFKKRKIAVKKQEVDITAENIANHKKMKKEEKEDTEGKGKLASFLDRVKAHNAGQKTTSGLLPAKSNSKKIKKKKKKQKKNNDDDF